MYMNVDLMNVKLDDGAYMPSTAHLQDAGYDLRTPIDFIIPGASEIGAGTVAIDTGVHVEIPTGCCGILISKSGLNTRHGITSTGLIDEGYTGSIVVKLYNHSGDIVGFSRGDKISQLVIVPCIKPMLLQVDELAETERGDNGFGSSGR